MLGVHHSLFALATIRLSTLLIRATLAFAIANGSPFVSVTKNMPIAMEGLLIDVHCHDLKRVWFAVSVTYFVLDV